ncbi:sensor histidine kinase [Mucilaginibacter sp. UYCu711]|uniref:sensor histidine kinase n=1 Tax=Mucilaginibacter sp. UYCu711 TaxID=3156339 RepID=UPI003D25B34E
MDYLNKINLKTIRSHILGWLAFICYEVSFIKLTGGSSFPKVDYVCYYTLNILLFYIHAHVVLKYALDSAKTYILLPGLVIFELAIYLIVKYILDYFLAGVHFSFFFQLTYVQKFVILNAYRGVYFIAFSSMYWAILRMIKFRDQAFEAQQIQLNTLIENARLEKNLAEAESAYLQQQINPHFLYNILTFIHDTYYKYSKEASQCILLLVDIMRYSFESVGPDGKANLTDEIAQLEHLIALNQVQFDYELSMDFHVDGILENNTIIPLVLLTLTENIFKHGYLKNNKQPARIHIEVDEDHVLHYTSWNLKSKAPTRKRARSVGIKNIIKRLDHTYKDKYSLQINQDEAIFEVDLMIQL